MKTLNRPTAPRPELDDLDGLWVTVRWMYQHEPPADTPDREAIVLALTMLEMRLERMRIKSLVDETPPDSAEVERCRAEIDRLRHAWFRPAPG